MPTDPINAPSAKASEYIDLVFRRAHVDGAVQARTWATV